MMTYLGCGHAIELAIGVRIYNTYDLGFGVMVHKTTNNDDPTGPWHDFESEGSTYWPKGRKKLLNPQRLSCVECGQEEARHHG